ncbi:hypothetical protein PV326_012134 [Microctonus aethiopoides]|nr:hypothetical protein PV326_012134 [Microctonus aethiopoides]
MRENENEINENNDDFDNEDGNDTEDEDQNYEDCNEDSEGYDSESSVEDVPEDGEIIYNDLNQDQPLYRGSHITVGQSMLSILTLMFNFHLPETIIEGIIELTILQSVESYERMDSIGRKIR